MSYHNKVSLSWFDNYSEALENYLVNFKLGYVSGLNARSKYLLCILYKHKVNIKLQLVKHYIILCIHLLSKYIYTDRKYEEGYYYFYVFH